MLGSVHDAEDALQEALLRAWRGLPTVRGPQLAALLALPDRDQHLPRRDRAAAQAGAADRLRPGRRPARAAPASRSSSRSGSSRTRTSRLGLDDGLAAPEARYEQRESVELAFVAALQHLPAQPARGADPARGARILRPRGRRVARHHGRVGQQRAAARAQDGRRARCPSSSQQATLRRSATSASASSSRTTSTRWSAATSTPSSRAHRGRRRGRCRRCRPGSAAARRSPRSWPSSPLSGAWRWRHVPDARERSAGGGLATCWDPERESYRRRSCSTC